MFSLLAVTMLLAVGNATGGISYQVPAAVASDCSKDVTQSLSAWIASVPNGSTLSFADGACYRVDGTLELTNRSGLVFEGHGASFEPATTGNTWRSQWRLVGGSNLVFRNMIVRGARPPGSGFVADLQHQHGFDLKGASGVKLDRVDVSAVYGDCVYIGQALDGSRAWSSNVHVEDSGCAGTGRMGVAVTAGSDVLVERSSFGGIGMTAFDVEPNGGASGFGGKRLVFRGNRIGSVGASVFDAIGDGPVDDVTLSNNIVSGQGFRLVVIAPSGQRRSNFTITGNVSDTGHNAPGSAALKFIRVDGVMVTGNTIPLSGANMALAWAAESTAVEVSGNSFPGGVVEARIVPAIGSFTPASGTAPTKVAIAGGGFTGATAVAFNGVPASFAVDSGSQLTAVVPPKATSGPITVTTAFGTATSPTGFQVEAAPTLSPPTIDSFTPTSGTAATRVTIVGSGFTNVTAVAFNGTGASFAVDSVSTITAVVPTNAASGRITVATPAGTATTPTSFQVTAPASIPQIRSFTPDGGSVGTKIAITGANFTGATAVVFNGSLSSFTVDSDSQITAVVPQSASSGPIGVTTPAGAATSTTSFTLTSASLLAPSIDAISPTSGFVGLTVRIMGVNLEGATSVAFGAVPASFTIDSVGQIIATVPAGAVSSRVIVSSPNGTATSGKRFRVLVDRW
ncbi:MAG: IPT/TIG domain-containing protein [Actinomycetota bacterium]|nr:IPT/TIG domain-containing protein [Actinomycetota bacterium]